MPLASRWPATPNSPSSVPQMAPPAVHIYRTLYVMSLLKRPHNSPLLQNWDNWNFSSPGFLGTTNQPVRSSENLRGRPPDDSGPSTYFHRPEFTDPNATGHPYMQHGDIVNVGSITYEHPTHPISSAMFWNIDLFEFCLLSPQCPLAQPTL